MSDPPCVECGTPTRNNYGGWIACDLCFHEIIASGPDLDEHLLGDIADGADIG